MSHRLSLAGLSSLLLCSTIVWADSVTIPNTFTAHTPAVAAQVNANFGAVATAVNDNATDIASLLTAIADLQTTVNTLNDTIVSQQTTINTLTNQMAAVQGSSVMELAAYLDMIDVPEPSNPAITYRTARFDGINVQIVDGTYNTGSRNGLGNLIVGYNGADPTWPPFCSKGSHNDQIACEGDGGTWAANQRTGSHNIIIGDVNSYTSYGGFVMGVYNIITGQFASVSGGWGNTASGDMSSVSGGEYNRASGYSSSVGGGKSNTATGTYSSVGGGESNMAFGTYSSVSGGEGNTANGYASSVSGGGANSASGSYSSVSGGRYNDASGEGS